jgi:hypothetical protein
MSRFVLRCHPALSPEILLNLLAESGSVNAYA